MERRSTVVETLATTIARERWHRQRLDKALAEGLALHGTLTEGWRDALADAGTTHDLLAEARGQLADAVDRLGQTERELELAKQALTAARRERDAAEAEARELRRRLGEVQGAPPLPVNGIGLSGVALADGDPGL